MTVDEAMMMKEIIKRAYGNGFDLGLGYKPSYFLEPNKIIVVKETMGQFSVTFSELFFNHDFAKSLFGREEFHFTDNFELSGGGKVSIHKFEIAWQLHLKKLSITTEKERIQYLYANS